MVLAMQLQLKFASPCANEFQAKVQFDWMNFDFSPTIYDALATFKP